MEGLKNCSEKKRLGKLSLKGRRILFNNELSSHITEAVSKTSSTIITVNTQPESIEQTSDDINITFNEGISTVATLPNLGSSCFCNVVMQVLRFTPGFLLCLHQITTVKSLWMKGEVPFLLNQLHGLFQELKSSGNGKGHDRNCDVNNSRSDILRKILKYFSEECTGYRIGQQYDAHEFLGWLLRAAACDTAECLLERKPTKRLSCFLDPFTKFREQFLEGSSKVILTCLECEKVKQKEEIFWDLPYNVSTSAEKDSKCGTVFSWDDCCKETIIQGEHKYWCEECLQYCEARHKISISRLPEVLILHPTKLTSDGSFSNSCRKNLDRLHVSDTLPCLCQVPCSSHQYQLYAIVVHIGSTLQSGHYITLLKFSDELCRLNSKLCIVQKEIRIRPTTRLRTELGHHELTVDQCCLPSNQDLQINVWILCDDEIIKSCDSSNTINVLKELGGLATPTMLFYFKCDT